jgi:hypothetical protein
MGQQSATTALCFLALTTWTIGSNAAEWTKETVVEGAAKPSLAVGLDNQPRVTFMLEARPGFVNYAAKRDAQWAVEHVASGYFYGPIDIVVAGERPIINYHDHEAEDQVVATRDGGVWTLNRIEHPGHDGWDNTIAVDRNGMLHTLTTDPVNFGGPGLEYASLIDGIWVVEEVGTGPIMYAEGLSLTFDSINRPHISYHNTGERSLYHGVKEASGWLLTRVDSGPEAGMFSSVEIAEGDTPVISYVAFTETGSAEIRLASSAGGQWSFETIDTVNDLTVGFSLARNATSLELDPAGNPHVAYSGESTIKYARKIEGMWQIEVVDTIRDNPGSRFGQQVELVQDGVGAWHLVSFDVTSSSPLAGNILYYRAEAQ